MAAWKWQREGIIMTELAHIVPRTFGQPQDQRRTKLQEALSGIPPAKHQQEFATALAIDKERRFELKSKLDELATDELERLLSLSAQRVGAGKLAEAQP
jgi:hypothetical protein